MVRVLIIALALLISGCTVGVRVKSCPDVDAAFVDDQGRYIVVPRGKFNSKRGWWPVHEDDSEAGESIFEKED